MAGGLSNYRSAMSSLPQIDAELKLVIAGNHDLELDSSWWLANLDEDDDPDEPRKALEVRRSGRDRGIHYLEEGVHRFTLQSGAVFSVYASAYTPDEDRFNGGGQANNPIPAGVDIVMTHALQRFRRASSYPTAQIAPLIQMANRSTEAARICGGPSEERSLVFTAPVIYTRGTVRRLWHGRKGAEIGYVMPPTKPSRIIRGCSFVHAREMKFYWSMHP
ncbi:uncharacterized protein PG986_001126 [Apiospora aurea]|uniref:Uncharacterized protein n=1 Tax=Apiospora aurea TaxID=335848 RepID=A0ABR1QW07_9PEZI